jgi:hypothetical protein
VTHVAVVLASCHLPAPYRAAPDRPDLIAAGRVHNWYHAPAESRAVRCRGAAAVDAEIFSCTGR